MKNFLFGLFATLLMSQFAFAEEIVCKQTKIGFENDTQELCAEVEVLKNGKIILTVKTDIAAFDIVREKGVKSDYLNDVCELFDFKGEALNSTRSVKRAAFVNGGAIESDEVFGQITAVHRMSCKL